MTDFERDQYVQKILIALAEGSPKCIPDILFGPMNFPPSGSENEMLARELEHIVVVEGLAESDGIDNKGYDYLHLTDAGIELVKKLPQEEFATSRPIHGLSTVTNDSTLFFRGMKQRGIVGYISLDSVSGNVPLHAYQLHGSFPDYLYTTRPEAERLESRKPTNLGHIGFVFPEFQYGTIRLRRYFNQQTKDHLYLTELMVFEGLHNYTDESDDHPMYIYKYPMPGTQPLYLYSNLSARLLYPIPQVEEQYSSYAPKSERINSLIEFAHKRGLNVNDLVFPNDEVEDRIRILNIRADDYFEINLDVSRRTYLMVSRPALNNGGEFFEVTMWRDVVHHFGEWVLKTSGSASGAQSENDSAKAETTPEESATDFTFRNEQVKAVLDVESQATIFFQLMKSIPAEENGLLLGVFGRWGRGKTYFWKQLKKQFRQTQGFIPLEFHAWKYQDTPASWAYIYELFADEFFKRPARFLWLFTINWLPYTKLMNRLKLNLVRHGSWGFYSGLAIVSFGIAWCFIVSLELKFWLLTSVISFLSIGVLFSILIYYFSYSGKAVALFRKYFSTVGFRNLLGIQAEIQKEFISLLCAWIPKKKVGPERLVLFVDDIDRCSEERIIQVIDSLKIMMDDSFISQRVIVIAAIDEVVLKRAIKQKYYKMVDRDMKLTREKKADELERLCREYMDKLFLNGFKLGKLTSQNMLDVLSNYADGKVFIPEELDKPSLVNNAGTMSVIGQNEESIPELPTPKAVPVDLPDQSGKQPHKKFELTNLEFQRLALAIRNIKEATPRSIRIFYYRYLVSRSFKDILVSKNSSGQQEWISNEDLRYILPYLIVEFSTVKSHSDLETEVSSVTQSSEKEITVSSLDKTFTLSPELYLALLKVVETVVPY